MVFTEENATDDDMVVFWLPRGQAVKWSSLPPSLLQVFEITKTTRTTEYAAEIQLNCLHFSHLLPAVSY